MIWARMQRHVAGVEHDRFRHVIAGETGDRLDVDVAPDPAMVDEAWRTWRGEITHADSLMARIDDRGAIGAGEPTPVHEVLVHLIREYAQHMGHADLLRERIDSRIGQ